MSLGRNQGVIVRSPGSWYVGTKAKVAGGWQQDPQTADLCFDLFNNATDASYLWVNSIYGYNDAEGSFRADPFEGHGATLLASGQAVAFDDPAPPGQLYVDTAAATWSTSTIAPDPAQGGFIMGGDEAGAFFLIAEDGPLAVIPQGWSLRFRSWISSAFNNRGLVITFDYSVVRNNANS